MVSQVHERVEVLSKVSSYTVIGEPKVTESTVAEKNT